MIWANPYNVLSEEKGMHNVIPNFLFENVFTDVIYRQKLDIHLNRNSGMIVLNFLNYTFAYIPIIKTNTMYLHL